MKSIQISKLLLAILVIFTFSLVGVLIAFRAFILSIITLFVGFIIMGFGLVLKRRSMQNS
ncbi:DUF5325 family protein [Saliterribacillus persicus]|uniref:DUF5325 family protein n=1 Tax=Saliterribacillus persicus TaxID=930114 RepID=A0A368XSA3_9BACI|nr:DUF5325 family protein [Saliterribacillus persicus]RCW70842.1 hypothetical protein DFR57_106243 [Saliterribacillus persicus]